MKEANFSSRREYWKQLIGEQSRSGLTQAEFCRDRGVSVGTFSSWKAQLKKECKSNAGGLVRVEVGRPEPMRIVFPGGAALHFAETPSPEWITELMKLVS